MPQVSTFRFAGVRLIGDGKDKDVAAKFAGSANKNKYSAWARLDSDAKPGSINDAVVRFIRLPKVMNAKAAAEFCLKHKAAFTSGGAFGIPAIAKIAMDAIKAELAPPAKLVAARKGNPGKSKANGKAKAKAKVVRKHR
jgi:hypothetical protein